MKIFEVAGDPYIRLSPVYEINGFNGDKKLWSTTKKIECDECEGTGKTLGLIGFKTCKKCGGHRKITISNLDTVVEYTPQEFKLIEKLLRIPYIDDTQVIPRREIPNILQKIIKFENTNQDHLNQQGSTEFSRTVEKDPTTNLSTIRSQRKTIEPVNAADIIKLISGFGKFLRDVQKIPDVSIIAQVRYRLTNRSL